MYLRVPLQGSPNTELSANNEHDLLPLQDVLSVLLADLQKQNQIIKQAIS